MSRLPYTMLLFTIHEYMFEKCMSFASTLDVADSIRKKPYTLIINKMYQKTLQSMHVQLKEDVSAPRTVSVPKTFAL